MRISLQPAFVLHTRPFHETSALVEIFSQNYGRFTAIAHSARSAKSRFRGLLRPFFPLLISWTGKTELVSLTFAEHASAPLTLSHSALLSGLYLNELLVRLLPKFDPHPELFSSYQTTLYQLPVDPPEPCLRLFEKALLQALGYGLSLNQDTTGTPIHPQQLYTFSPTKGFLPTQTSSSSFRGENLLAFAEGIFKTSEDLRTAKQITRLAIGMQLGNHVVKTRELFPGSM